MDLVAPTPRQPPKNAHRGQTEQHDPKLKVTPDERGRLIPVRLDVLKPSGAELNEDEGSDRPMERSSRQPPCVILVSKSQCR